MGITPLVVKQKEFTTRFRGVDVQEVDYFLEEGSKGLENLNHSIQKTHEENQKRLLDLNSIKNHGTDPIRSKAEIQHSLNFVIYNIKISLLVNNLYNIHYLLLLFNTSQTFSYG